MPTLPTTKGYTDHYLVADALGTHDGIVPVGSLDFWIAAAEQWIDIRTGRSWGITSVTGEQQTFEAAANTRAPLWDLTPLRWTPNNGWADPLVQLKVFPVAAITAVRARYLSLGATTYLLAATDYELVDAARGWLLVSTKWVTYRLSIDYTVTVPVPAAIQLAATQMVTAWVQPMLVSTDTKALSGIKSYSIGQDLSVTFQDSYGSQAMTTSVPPSVLALVDQYRVRSPVV